MARRSLAFGLFSLYSISVVKNAILGNRGKQTRTALLWMKLTSEPLVALYTLLPFILRKDLHASVMQISLFTALKPVLAVLAYYLSIYHARNGKSVMKNLIHAWALAYLPFLFVPWLGSYSYILLAAGCYQLFSKAVTPPLMEILKRNIPKKPRENLFSKSVMLSFALSAVLGLFIGRVLDWGSWQMLFSISAAIALTSYHIQRQLPRREDLFAKQVRSKNPILDPLKGSLQLVRENEDFKTFQIGFMIGGSALMFVIPALAIYYADVLALSHTKITQARFVLMTMGVLISSTIWKNFLGQSSINRLMPWITIGFGLFPICVLFAHVNLAFFLYGVAQAGSHLIWHLSGTIFAKDGDSTPYTAVNILTQGVRGLVMPLLGGLACTFVGPVAVLITGSVACFVGAFVMYRSAYQRRPIST